MKFIDPTDLKIPRVYFTEFDRITYSQVAWTAEDVEEIKHNLERKVKLLGLIKGVVGFRWSCSVPKIIDNSIFGFFIKIKDIVNNEKK